MDLPEHIQLLIAFHLPLVDCKALSCTCKAWNLTARQNFWRFKTYQLRKKQDNGKPSQPNVDWKVTYEVYQRFLEQCKKLVDTFSQLAEQNNQLRTQLDALQVNMREQNNQLRTRLDALQVNMRDLEQRRQIAYEYLNHEADSSSLDGSEYDSSDS